MNDLYIENFFRGQIESLPAAQTENTPVELISEESISQIHFYLRILKEEIDKQLKETPPFPLILENLETAIFSQNNDEVSALLDDLEELLDLQYLSKY